MTSIDLFQEVAIRDRSFFKLRRQMCHFTGYITVRVMQTSILTCNRWAKHFTTKDVILTPLKLLWTLRMVNKGRTMNLGFSHCFCPPRYHSLTLSPGSDKKIKEFFFLPTFTFKIEIKQNALRLKSKKPPNQSAISNYGTPLLSMCQLI